MLLAKHYRLRIVSTLAIFIYCLIYFSKALAEIPPSKAELLQIQENDIVMGCAEAPLTLIEYSSLSCVHCARFHNQNFEEIKKRFIDTCKIKYVYRDYPTTMSSLTGAIVAHCLADSNEKYFQLLFAMFASQTSWVFQQNYADSLLSILKLYGVEEDKFKLCLKNQNISSTLTKKSFEAGKMFDIKYTPTFFLNDEKIEGEIQANELEEKIKKLSLTR